MKACSNVRRSERSRRVLSSHHRAQADRRAEGLALEVLAGGPVFPAAEKIRAVLLRKMLRDLKPL